MIDEPVSLNTTRIAMASPQITTTGPNCLNGGSVIPRNRLPPCTST
jgi:hypothetical protein